VGETLLLRKCGFSAPACGGRVYRAYRNDCIDHPLYYWYGLSPYCSEQEEEYFDVRDVAFALGWRQNEYDWEEIGQVLAAAIDKALAGEPAACGRDFARCWARRVTAPPDPVVPVAGLIGGELAAALSEVLTFCREVIALDREKRVFAGLPLDPATLEAPLALLQHLLREGQDG
jgi:hypothetical protein